MSSEFSSNLKASQAESNPDSVGKDDSFRQTETNLKATKELEYNKGFDFVSKLWSGNLKQSNAFES